MTDEQLLEYRKTQIAGLREENSKLREDLREGKALREMSIERKILKKILMLYREDKSCMNWGTANEIQELLAQPVQEPVAWIDDGSLKSLQESTGYALRFLTNDTESLKNTDVPLYLAPPTRNPLTPQQISVGNQSMFNVTREAFVKGVKWAEKAHGIGVDDE